jgi:uncharacterized protein
MSSLDPDLELCRRFLAIHPPRGRVLLCAITGSHHYGFPSPDSDIDMKGIHVAPTRSLLGLSRPSDAHDRLLDFEGVECDLTSNEIGQALGLLLRGNGNVLERILSPYQLVKSEELERLGELARGALSRSFHGHYRGFFGGVQREFDKADVKRAKPLLYCYRVALTGVHLLRTGQLVAHLPTLAEEYGYPDIEGLMQKKRSTSEQVELTADEVVKHRAAWARLEEEIAAAKEASPLPEKAANTTDVEAWLIELRVAELEV